MKNSVRKWFGIYQYQKEMFISTNLRHIEIYESEKWFWITTKERAQEVHIAPFSKLSKENLQLIYEAYEDLHNVAKELKSGGRKRK